MEIPILIKRIGDEYVLRCRNPVALELKALSYAEGRDDMQSQLSAILGTTVEVVPIQDDPQNPWLMSAGWLPEDEIAKEWVAAMKANRERDSASDENPLASTKEPKTLAAVNGVGS